MSKKQLPDIQTKNKDIITSFIYTWARQKEMSILEQRIVLRIIEYASNNFRGYKLKDHLEPIDLGLSNVQITIPVSSVLFKTKMLYQDIRGALKSLRDRSFEYWDENHYTVCGFINKATYVYGTGMIIVEVDNQMWDVLSDFTKGFRRFELNKALALPTSASLQFYMIVSGQQKPFDLSIEELKNWLGISPDKYKKDGKDRVDHLEERVLRPVMKILDDTCPYSFTYKKLRKNEQNSKSPVIGFRFVPVKNEKNRDQALEKASLSGKICVGLIAPQITNYMKYRMGIPSKSLAPHKELIMKANRLLPDFIGTLADIQGRRRTKDGEEKGIGWVIQAIRGEVENAEKVPNKGK